MPAAAELTPALVLGAIRYGETSRIVRLLTRTGGVRSAIAKGATRPRSPFGAALQFLSEGTAHLLPTRGDLHTLTAFDLANLHAGLGRDLERFRTASALAEVVLRFVPPQGNPPLYDQVLDALALIELAPTDALPVVGLRALWQLVGEFGLTPVTDHCARDGAPLPGGEAGFSFRDGGLLCAACARGGVATRLGPSDRVALDELLRVGADLPVLDARHAMAHRRLLVRWIQTHLGDSRLPALDAWQRGGTPLPDDTSARPE